MRNFEEIKNELKLEKFLASELGTLYFIPFNRNPQRILVRYFDQKSGANYLAAYVELMNAIQEWIKSFPDLGKFVRVEQPVEIGLDFVARFHHTYIASIGSYDDDEDPPEPPAELAQMREVLRKMIGKANTAEDKIIERVIIRSLLEPTGKTYFSGKEGKFIIVEPKILPIDLEQWLSVKRES